MKKLRKVLKAIVYGLFLVSILLLALEVIFRTQWVDLYRTELVTFNSQEELESTKMPTLLLLGDSFSAGNYTWAYHLKEKKANWRVINSGVSGTGIIQQQAIGKRRVKEFAPRRVILQVYVGNDLFDIRYPVNWKTVSFSKNLYWSVAQRLRSLAWLNYRAAQVWTASTHSQEELEALAPVKNAVFSAEAYSEREKSYLRADENLVEDQVYLEGGREKDHERLVTEIQRFAEFCEASGAELTILVVPHPAMVNPEYARRIAEVGAKIDHSEMGSEEEYPFVAQLRMDLPHTEVWDATQFLRAQDTPEQPLFFANDCHLNLQGQEKLTEFVAQRLSD